MKNYNMTWSLLMFVLLWMMRATGWSQPEVHITHIDNYDFPKIVIAFEVKCGSVVHFDLKPKNLTVMEEGKEVNSLQLVCPLPGQNQCCLSTAVFVDRAARFDDSVRYRVRDVLYEFFDHFDGSCDEGTLVTVGNHPVVKVFMTNDKDLLKNGLDAIYPGSHTALWDGLYSVISELLNNASNLCRDILLVSSGIDDAGSRNTIADCIRFARDNNVHVFPVIFPGEVRIDTLRAIAEATGGRVLFDPNTADIDTLYSALKMKRCRVQYRSSCPDGTLRKLELMVGWPEHLAHCNGVGRDSVRFTAKTKTRMDVLTMPDSLIGDPDGSSLRPNPFSVSYRIRNDNCNAFKLSQSSLLLEAPDTNEVKIQNPVQTIDAVLNKGDSLVISWMVKIMSNTRDCMRRFVVKTKTSNGMLEMRDSVFIPAVSISAISEISEVRSFQVGEVYPNPVLSGAKNLGFLVRVPFSVMRKIAVGFSIVNTTGTEIFAVEPRVYSAGSYTISIPMAILRPGVYLVIIKGPVRVYFRKILVL